jgi:transcriptional regulator with XRE-family HTH domain
MENQEKFRTILRRYRKAHGISQDELAAAAGISRPTLANFETGLFNLSAISMERVGDALLRLIEGRAKSALAATVSYRRCLSSGEMRAGA